MSRTTALTFLVALAVMTLDPMGTAPTAVAQQRCLRMAVLTIDAHERADEDGRTSPTGWFPLICRHGAKFAKTGRPTDVDINGKPLAAKDDFTEICGLNAELGRQVSHWIANARLNDDTPTHGEDRICLALHPVGLYCGARANMADVMSFRAIKGDIPIAVNADYCPDR